MGVKKFLGELFDDFYFHYCIYKGNKNAYKLLEIK